VTGARRSDPTVEDVLGRLIPRVRTALGQHLRGVYLFGSAVTGAFERGVSDVDLAAVLTRPLASGELSELALAHREIADETPDWADRIEVVYVTERGLATFRERPSRAARISPGEPFHEIEVDRTWVIDWYQLREVGVALVGPPVEEIVPSISNADYREGVREHLRSWPLAVDALPTQGAQAYAILTMCRGLRTVRTGEHVSKADAVRWGCDVLPEHADLIRASVAWRERARRAGDVEGSSSFDETVAFIRDVQRRLGDEV
jgi:predicted nucleotidyltransferase